MLLVVTIETESEDHVSVIKVGLVGSVHGSRAGQAIANAVIAIVFCPFGGDSFGQAVDIVVLVALGSCRGNFYRSVVKPY